MPRTKTLAITCLALWTLLTLATHASQATEPLKLIFITCCRDEAFFGPTKKGMADAAKMMGVRCEFTGTEGVDLAAQAAMVRRAVADGYDGIALNIIDAKAFNEAIAEAMQKGVPVVAFNTDAADGSRRNARLAGICQNYIEAGRMLGRKALGLIPPGSKVLITQHDRGVASLDDRLRGIQESLDTKGIASKVICSTNEPKQAIALISAELKADPKIRFVLGTGQTDTEAAGRVIERDFPGKGYGSAGFDLSPEILRLLKADVIRLTIDQQPYTQGFYPVVQLTLYLRHGIQPSNIDAGAGVITKKDVERLLELSRQKTR